ncbi:hypothetical protein YO5_04994 [Stutzerimonas stutzeri TS44]|nr:hypothetical protein YO5_04994 [Stutzerimonas stutzeri TS44]
MQVLSLSWLVMGLSLCVVLLTLGALCVLWLGYRRQRRELHVLRDLLHDIGATIRRLEREKAEFFAGLRAEKAHVAQLRRQLELLRLAQRDAYGPLNR